MTCTTLNFILFSMQTVLKILCYILHIKTEWFDIFHNRTLWNAWWFILMIYDYNLTALHILQHIQWQNLNQILSSAMKCQLKVFGWKLTAINSLIMFDIQLSCSWLPEDPKDERESISFSMYPFMKVKPHGNTVRTSGSLGVKFRRGYWHECFTILLF